MSGILLGIFIAYEMAGFYFALGYVGDCARGVTRPLTWGWLALHIVFWPWVLTAKCAVWLANTRGGDVLWCSLLALWRLLDRPIRKEDES